MNTFVVTVYTGQFKETIEVEAKNQDHLKKRIKGLGYDRISAIHRTYWIMTFLYLLNILAELIQLVFELGTLTRKYLVPAVVYCYVATEYVWDYLTSQEIQLNIIRTPLTTGFAY